MSRTSLRSSRTAVAAAVVVAVAACGGGDEPTGADPTTAGSLDTAGGVVTASSEVPSSSDGVGVALILKNTSNPFFVSMSDSARAEAEALGVELTVAAGTEDGDTDTQIAAIEDAVDRGDAGILITPNGDAVVPALEAAREAGLYTIALDTPPNPADAVDITFATDNRAAGVLIGEWTAATLEGAPATIAMLDLFDDQVISVDVQRDQGFLLGMGIIDEVDTSGNGEESPTGEYRGGEYEIVCHEATQGAVDGGRSAMEACLAQDPDVDVVYTINEPAAQGAFDALTAAGSAQDVIIVSVDGGCDPGLRLVSEGVIGATSQQYPGRMATLGMEAIAELAAGGDAPEVTPGLDFFDTGVSLVTDSPVDGVDSISVAEGREICWG
ncbi:substrate-binding domain-containing protein [Ilumatobacter sp.]|uniref:substrate-binding domain-containing protein n=1 Tax=Ilumatobacter sp. TaxID=1967498 RepID=UPI003B521DF6